MPHEIGERVGAIRSADRGTVNLFGYGVYAGDEIPPDDVLGPFGHLGLFGAKNPKLVLDDGTAVWGCECWWSTEARVLDLIAGRAVVMVAPERRSPTDEERREAFEIINEANRKADALMADLAKEIK